MSGATKGSFGLRSVRVALGAFSAIDLDQSEHLRCIPFLECDLETREAIMIGKTLLAASAVCLGTFSGAYADDHAGKEEFMVACAVCHGESAKGDGPFAAMMNIGVPGLTGLAAANDGVFPFLEAFAIVDGRTGMRAHGGPMPIWGNRYKSEAENLGPYSSEIITRGRIAVLVDYLQSIQE